MTAPTTWARGRRESVLCVLAQPRDRTLAAGCFAAAFAAYWLQSIAWPLMTGRDAATYLMYYRDMWTAHPSFPELMLYRTPLAPLLNGALLQAGGPTLLEFGLAVAFATSVAAYAAAAAGFGRRAAVLVAVALLVFPSYAALFHEISSDCVFAFTLAIWTLVVARTAAAPSLRRYALLAVVLLALVLARPSSQVLIATVLIPFLVPGSWRRRFVHAGVFLACSLALLAAWSGYNALRYGQFTVARTGGASVPFYRVFIVDKLVRPENGPASRKLAAAAQSYLLWRPVYRKQHIDLQRFFEISSDHEWGDLIVMSDRIWGWNDNYSVMRAAALEAIRAQPKLYLRSVASAMKAELWTPYSLAAPTSAAARTAAYRPPTAAETTAANAAAERADPGGVLWWIATTPDGRIRAANGRFIFETPAAQRRYERMTAWVDRMEGRLPDRSGSSAAAAVLNAINRGFPRMPFWLAAGVVAIALRRPRGWRVAAFLCALAFALLLGTMASVPASLEYGLPFDPVFILFGAVGLVGVRARRAVPSVAVPAE